MLLAGEPCVTGGETLCYWRGNLVFLAGKPCVTGRGYHVWETGAAVPTDPVLHTAGYTSRIQWEGWYLDVSSEH